MIVNGQRVDIEVQVSDGGDYPERSLYYWAREFSTGIYEGDNYSLLPRTIVISILGFNQFVDTKSFHSEYQVLNVTTHEPLTDKMVLHYYELKKLPPLESTDTGRDLWLKLFKSETEEELEKIEKMGVPIMSETIGAYRKVTSSSEFREIERLRTRARHDEAQAMHQRDKYWKGIVADKDAEIEHQAAEIENQAAEIENQATEIEKLAAEIEKLTTEIESLEKE